MDLVWAERMPRSITALLLAKEWLPQRVAVLVVAEVLAASLAALAAEAAVQA